MTRFSARVSPPKLGGVAAAVRKFSASSLTPQTGWFQSRHVSECSLETFPRGNHPVRFAATPPNLGGGTLAKKLQQVRS